MTNLKKIKTKLEAWMIPLRTSLIFTFGASSSIGPFIQVYMKSKGLDVGEIAVFYIISSCLQFLFLIGSGVIIDKIGNSKFVVLGSLVLVVLSLNGMLFVPNVVIRNCEENVPYITQLNCYQKQNTSSDLFLSNSTEIQKYSFDCHQIEGILNIICYSSSKSIDCFYELNADETRETNISWTNNNKRVFIVFDNSNNGLENYIKEQIVIQHELILNCDYNSFIRNDNKSCSLIFSNRIDENPCDNLPERVNFLYFILLLICFLGYMIMITIIIRTMDTIVMSLATANNLDFGRERFWAIVSSMIFLVLSGYIVENLTEPGHAPYYESAIYLFDACVVLAIISVYVMDIKIEKSEKRLFQKSILFLMNADTITFFIIVLILGTCYNFQTHFSSLYLDSLGASSFLLALKPASENLYGLPFLVFSDFFVKNGNEKVFFILAFVGYVLHFIGYAYLENPWWSLIIEVTGFIHHHLLWVAVIRYSYTTAPKGLTSTVIAISGALHFCIGSGTGSLLGGLVMSEFGGRTAYKVMAVMAGISGFLYAFYVCLSSLCTKWKTKNSNFGDKNNERQRLIST